MGTSSDGPLQDVTTLELYTITIPAARRKAVENLSVLVTNMVTSWSNWETSCRWRLSGFNELNGRHEETRTPDLYRVNFEVTYPKPSPYLAFPQLLDSKKIHNCLVLMAS